MAGFGNGAHRDAQAGLACRQRLLHVAQYTAGDHTGQTVFDAETPYLQFGWYGFLGHGTNQVEFGPITVTNV